MTWVYPFASICERASLSVKLLAPATGAAELLSCMPLTAGFCGPFCESVWADAAPAMSAVIRTAVANERMVSSKVLWVQVLWDASHAPCAGGKARGDV